jgi:3-phenylpropionate/trans-cinnamate dioxygenase ferredoxin reductase component
MSKTCIIIGASHGGSQAALSLRQMGWQGKIVLIGAEKDLPYHRPPLSKDYLAGRKSFEQILLRPQAAYEKADIDLRLGVTVTAIDRAHKTVMTAHGEKISYDNLVLATGASARILPVPGAEREKVFYLRNAEDARAIQGQIKQGHRAVVIGGGYIGLEMAASLRGHGMEVSVLEAMDRILQRVTAPEVSKFFKRIHEEEGVCILEHVAASAIISEGLGLSVLTEGGARYPADMVIIGIGVLPAVSLAKGAGLKLEDGVMVNQFCQTSDPDIYAVGDVTWHHHSLYQNPMRLESVPNATEQAKIFAAHLTGKPKPYGALPWFWSDQFDLKLQIAGLSQGYDNLVIRGDIEKSHKFAAFYFLGDQLLAVDAVNDPQSFMVTKMVLSQGKNLDRKMIADVSSDLKQAIIG